MLVLDELPPRALEMALAAAALALDEAELAVDEARDEASCQLLDESPWRASSSWRSRDNSDVTKLELMLRSVTLASKMYRLELPVTPVRPTISIQMMLAVVRINGRATQKNLPTFPMAN